MKGTDKREWSGILVYLECYKGQLHAASEELIGEAVRLSQVSGDLIYAAGVGQNMERIQEALNGYPVAKAYLYESEDEYESPLYTKILSECIEELKPAIVLVGGTYEGRSLAPGLAVRFQTGLTADCTGLAINEEGNLVQSRPAFGGNIMADIVTQFGRPQFATVRPGVMQKVDKSDQNVTEYVNKKVKKESKEIEIISSKAEKVEKGITEEKILIVAGRGVKKKEDLEMLKELAGLLGGKLASSRALVEKGWMLPKEQIGLSGNTVSPDYMITCGVSGTVQFMAGMKNTKNIIAINEDPKARIFEIAHYPMVGDLYEIVPELIRIIKERRSLRFQYQLTRAEIEEALLCLDYKKEGKFRDINVGVISLIGVGALIAYMRNTQQFFWMVLLGIMVLLLLYIIYVPAVSRKRRAKKIAWEKGTYNVRIQKDKIQYGDKEQSVKMTGKNTEAYISGNLYVLRVDREVFTIPKRIMKEKEEQELERILRETGSKIVHITIERGEKL